MIKGTTFSHVKKMSFVSAGIYPDKIFMINNRSRSRMACGADYLLSKTAAEEDSWIEETL